MFFNLILDAFKLIIFSLVEFYKNHYFIVCILDQRKRNYRNGFKKTLRTILPDIRAGHRSFNQISDLITDYHLSPFAKSNFKYLLSTRQKEINTIEDIVYRNDYPPNVQRVVGDDSNSCLSSDRFVILFKLGILPEDPEILGK